FLFFPPNPFLQRSRRRRDERERRARERQRRRRSTRTARRVFSSKRKRRASHSLLLFRGSFCFFALSAASTHRGDEYPTRGAHTTACLLKPQSRRNESTSRNSQNVFVHM